MAKVASSHDGTCHNTGTILIHSAFLGLLWGENAQKLCWERFCLKGALLLLLSIAYSALCFQSEAMFAETFLEYFFHRT